MPHGGTVFRVERVRVATNIDSGKEFIKVPQALVRALIRYFKEWDVISNRRRILPHEVSEMK